MCEKDADQGQTKQSNYERLFNNPLVGILLVNIEDCQIMEYNDRLLEMFGYSQDETENLVSFIDREIVDHIVNSGELTTEVCMKRKDGSDIWARLYSYADMREGIIESIIIDITDEKEAKRAIVKSHKLYQKMFDKTLIGITVIASDPAEIVYVNPVSASHLGYSVEELYNLELKGLASKIHPEDREWVMKLFSDRISGQEDVSYYEYRGISKDGTTIWFENYVSLIDYEGRPASLVISSDITERKLSEIALKESEERNRSLLESFRGIVYRTNIDTELEYFEGAVQEITGYTPEEILREEPALSDIVHPDDYEIFSEHIEKLMNENISSSEQDYRIVRKDGRVKWVLDFVYKIPDDDGNPLYYQGTIHDITDRKEMYNQRDQRRELELYTALLSHDIGNDLQTMISYVDIAMLDIDSMSDDMKKMLSSVSAATDRISYLLKSFSIPEKDVDRRVVKLLKKIAKQAEEANHELRIKVHSDVSSRFMMVNAGRLLPMCFENLFRNTAQHGGTEVNVSVKRDENKAIITVADNGPGIPDSIKDTLFERGCSTKGGGLGLYLARQILEGYGGSIELLDTNENGTTFLITIPISRTF